MADKDNAAVLKSIRTRNYLARDFNSFRGALLEYAREYYPDKIQDFSESSIGGLFLDMAAYIGDNMSFYLDHLYGEMNADTVVETKNAEAIIKNAGVKINGASSSMVYIDFYIEVPVDLTLKLDVTLLPTIKRGSVFSSDGGINFVLTEDVDFWEPEDDITTDATIKLARGIEPVNGRRVGGRVVSQILKKSGLCASGSETTEVFSIGDFVPFRKITLSPKDVSKIISITDSYDNVYYEVENLTHDVVYKNVLNTAEKDEYVKDSLKLVPAPYRFTKSMSLSDRRTTLTFGGGSADTLDDDIIPDPSEFALPLPYSQTFSRLAINPEKMLQTSTLGIVSINTSLTITYRHGGGLSHNVPPNSIRNIRNVSMSFPENPQLGLQVKIKNSLELLNPKEATGGEDAPTVAEMLELIPIVKNSQERIVTKEDLLARIYSMPSNLGRVFRAAVSKNPSNPLAAQVHIISRSSDLQLIPSSDALKNNLKRYLNSYRMISDSMDVMDAAIINLEVYFSVVVDPSINKSLLLQNIISDLQDRLNIKNFHINQPLIISDLTAVIFSKRGVISVDEIKVRNMYGTIKNLEYSPLPFDVQLNTKNQIIYPPTGAIFEVKYPDINIIGKAVTNV